MRVWLFPKVKKGMEARYGKIRADLESAEATKADAEREVADYQSALAAVRAEAESESDHFVQGPFLPEVQGARINAGKKTTILDFDAQPRINGNNYRQALAQSPGLILSEENSPLVSIGYRGLEPHRAQFTQVLKDGIPIHADQFGYPEAYYTPPLDTVDRIEFVRGGASLLYGPQPGGALNYVTHRPRTDRPFSGSTLHTAGSNGYYSTFTHLDGTTGRVGYYGYLNHRQSDGIRASNSDYRLTSWLGRLALDATTDARWLLTLETYDEEHGEPGGLTFATGANAVNYSVDRRAVSRPFDRFRLERAEAEKHVVEGLLAALEHLDAIIKLIRAAADRVTASEQLQDRFGLSEVQADANQSESESPSDNDVATASSESRSDGATPQPKDGPRAPSPASMPWWTTSVASGRHRPTSA